MQLPYQALSSHKPLLLLVFCTGMLPAYKPRGLGRSPKVLILIYTVKKISPDAPMHFIENGAGMGELPLDVFYGNCIVKVWDGVIPQGCKRLLIKGDYQLTVEDAELIVKSGIRLIGVEGQSVGATDNPAPVHLALLGAGIVALEGVVLGRVDEGEYTLCALPLNLGKCDGSPARAVLIDTAK